MSVTGTNNRNDYTGNGSSTVFVYSFIVQNASDMAVYLNGVLKALTTDYSISNVGIAGGGNVTFVVAPPSGATVSLQRAMTYDQQTVYVDNDTFAASTLNNALDKATMLIQQLLEKIGRSLAFGTTSTFSGVAVPDPAASNFLQWDATGTKLQNAVAVVAGANVIPSGSANKQLLGWLSSALSWRTPVQARGDLASDSVAYTYAAAATLPVTNDPFQLVTGTATVTALAAQPLGTVIAVKWPANVVLTYDATKLQLIGQVNYTTVANDISIFVCYDGTNWKETGRLPLPLAAVSPVPIAALRSYLAGAQLSNDGGAPTTTLDVSAGTITSDDQTVTMALSAITGTISGTFVVGTGQPKLDTGTVATSTWYHVYVIERTDTSVVDILFSTSASAPTMPTNYTKKRRIGSFKTDGSSHILAFTQNGDYFRWAASVLDVNTTPGVTTAVTITFASVPLGVNVFPLFNTEITDTAATAFCYISDLNANDEAPSGSAAPLGMVISPAANASGQAGPVQVRVNTSQQARLRTSTTNSTIRCATLGWQDRRGKDA